MLHHARVLASAVGHPHCCARPGGALSAVQACHVGRARRTTTSAVGGPAPQHALHCPSTRCQRLPTLVASCLRGALPPVDLRAVCLVRAIVTGWELLRVGGAGCDRGWIAFRGIAMGFEGRGGGQLRAAFGPGSRGEAGSALAPPRRQQEAGPPAALQSPVVAFQSPYNAPTHTR